MFLGRLVLCGYDVFEEAEQHGETSRWNYIEKGRDFSRTFDQFRYLNWDDWMEDSVKGKRATCERTDRRQKSHCSWKQVEEVQCKS